MARKAVITVGCGVAGVADIIRYSDIFLCKNSCRPHFLHKNIYNAKKYP